jgi:D-alanyl-D-alanine carboxypeptidase
MRHPVAVLLTVVAAGLVVVSALLVVSFATRSGSSSDPEAASQSGHPDIDDASSITVVVNKQRALSPLDYTPADLVTVNVAQGTAGPVRLRADAAHAAEALFAAFATETGHELESESAYRSYADQQSTYDSIASSIGDAGAADSAAKPGYSEHQTGLAIDVGQRDSSCRARDCFADTDASAWLRKHAYEYGFIIRYPAGQESVTGYEAEPWHLRYLGRAFAEDVHFHASSLEAYFGLGAAPDYAG